MQFRSPYLRRDIDKIEKIQRRATKMIPEIRKDSYHQRIQDFDLIGLVQRRLRGQLIEVFKCLRVFPKIFAHGNSKNEIKQRNRGSPQDAKNEYGKNPEATKKKVPKS